MSKIKTIKNLQDYEEALSLLKEYLVSNPDPDSEEGEQLAILSTLIEDYEKATFSTSLPTPVEAIKFRMDQLNLKPFDLIPYIGSKSRVSEVLSEKRTLTIEMIRALESGLGIPAKVLIQEADTTTNASLFSNWSSSLVKDMWKRGCFGSEMPTKKNLVGSLENFFSGVGFTNQMPVMLRQSNFRSAPASDKKALAAWMACVVKKSTDLKPQIAYVNGMIDLAFMSDLAKLSINPLGPLLAQTKLMEVGITLVIEKAFPKTRLDGAVIFTNKENPIIGLTLRHDRLDNFWFTLMHELGHIALHYDSETEVFYDELEDVKGMELGDKEKAADGLASEALIPESKWEISPAKLIPSTLAASSLAKEAGVHIAIVAGKIRFSGSQYKYLNKIIEEAKVRYLFSNIQWD